MKMQFKTLLIPVGNCYKKHLHRHWLEKSVIKATLLTILFLVNIPLAYCANFQAWMENGTKKIRQDITPVTQSSITIKAARNEFEPFQLVFKNTSSGSRSNIDVSISNFTGEGRTISNSNVTIFKEEYLNITSLSNIDGQLGEWPDALMPKVDAYYHETRSTFPLSVSAGRVQPIWFDVFVPANATPGNYTATVTLTENSALLFTGTVNLTVWDFVLPATSSLPSYFTANKDEIWRGFFASEPMLTTSVSLQRDFIKAGLRHRLTFSGIPFSFGSWNSATKTYSSFTSTYYVNSIAGFIDGTATGIEYGAASLTSFAYDFSNMYKKYVTIPGLCTNGATEPPQGLYDETYERARLIASLFTDQQKALFYILPLDEPGTGGDGGCAQTNPDMDYKGVKMMSRAIRAAGLKVRETASRRDGLLNTDNNPASNDYIDRWSPWLGSIVGQGVDKLSSYSTDIANGAQLWWYQSCMTGGCGIEGTTSGYRGWPQYFVEYSAMHSRVFPWMTFKYGIMGETYWGVVGMFGKSSSTLGDPYYSLYSSTYHKNADGAFFYPGVANTTTAGLPTTDGRGAHTMSIGGTHNIPIESIRLKMIREGYEDYEYFKILKDLGDSSYAQERIADIVTNTYTFNSNEDLMFSAREQLANRILTLQGTGDSNPVNSMPPARPRGIRKGL